MPIRQNGPPHKAGKEGTTRPPTKHRLRGKQREKKKAKELEPSTGLGKETCQSKKKETNLPGLQTRTRGVT